ncbi:helix-turn-helix domain-containing protein [Cronobacter sakazakii]|uniref:helix-turn-helix domain-containing protein n=2 Tax=Cronobacter sakazakii TaxID=28141 RepID=UPI0002B2814E|nr:helix-turn-helix transcriptional regulator [Cronobacter sakazakii]MDK1222680.1 helix-turn-helix transcriptional regulator [Cronobacter turicensis]AGE87751.1 sugar fermentation stimulation protein B [Cronobacter sakazakii SP291]ALB51930.1 sugar fermentation stimulation protein B [Cronobacter sakazakii]EGT0040226.1 transcriptional regulator [Cronobacter sakazakii]EGT4239695.1 transcriptional regulator [Cronobacter sakazakii]
MTTDWHPADIIAALRKKGTSLAALSRASGLGFSTLANALTRPWPKGEYLIAEALDVHPSIIWPSRYFKDGVVVERRELMRRRDLTVNASLQDNEEN